MPLKNSRPMSENMETNAKWLERIALLALLIMPLTVLGYRAGLYAFSGALVLLGISLLIALITFLVSLLVSLKCRKTNPKKSKQAQLATYLSLLPLLFLGSQVITAKSVPRIHNISTDVIDPPEFNELVEVRGENSNPHFYNIEQLSETQQAAYPNIKTLEVKESVANAFNNAILVVEQLNWDLISVDQQSGIIEASETSFLWGFTDDVVIRVKRKNDGGTNVDLRSVSRVGQSDLGTNAKRIHTFLKAYLNLTQ